MTEQANTWIENATTRKKFWAVAQDQFGLDHGGVHEVLKVESLKDFTGTFEDAITALRAAVEAQPATASGNGAAFASWTVKAFDADGFDCMLTLRDDDTQRLMGRAVKSLEWLKKQGFEPLPPRRRNGGQPAAAAPAAGNGGEAPAWCNIHSAKMNRHEKNGDVWYSHKAHNQDGSEFWCRGK